METTDLQQSPMAWAQPGPEHEWLHRLVGEWSFEGEALCKPGDPVHRSTGTETVRTLGGLWILAEGESEMPGGGIGKSLMTLGYDPARGRYAGTWVGSMMTHLWIYDGEMSADRRVLTLHAEGPTMESPGKTTQYKDIIELVSDDHRRLTSHMLGENGVWNHFMTADYRRRA